MLSSSLLRRKIFSRVLALTVAVLVLQTSACNRQAYREAGLATSDPWGSDQLIQPEELVKLLSAPATGRPLLLHIGVPDLYRRMHISGSTFVGMTSTPEGIQRLKEEVQKLPLDTGIIIYCGCCPWYVCPNTRPAFQILLELGFKNVKVLYLAHNLQRDWAERGFPVEKGAGVASRRQD